MKKILTFSILIKKLLLLCFSVIFCIGFAQQFPQAENTIRVMSYNIQNGKADVVASNHLPLFADVRLKTAKEKIFRSPVYLQNPATDGITIMWHTNVPCLSWVEYGTDSLNMQRVLMHHIPIYNMRNPFNPSREEWGQILAKAPFDISINAHTHRFNHIPIGEDKNKFPIVVGGGNNEQSATVMILRKQGKQMTLTALNAEGETLISLKL